MSILTRFFTLGSLQTPSSRKVGITNSTRSTRRYVYKGVVFNEMKGSYSSPDDRLNEFSQRSLFPDTVYGLDSGGDPRHIPDLTYADFKAFHQRYYHPSNARLFFYGDDDPDERLRLLDSWLRAFDPIAVDSMVAHRSVFPHHGDCRGPLLRALRSRTEKRWRRSTG